jgi:hypothetical protein
MAEGRYDGCGPLSGVWPVATMQVLQCTHLVGLNDNRSSMPVIDSIK